MSQFVSAFMGLILVGMFAVGPPLYQANSQSAKNPFAQKASTANHLPRRLYIPKLNINTSVESVGLDDEGKMATPENDNHAAWYKHGPMPGETGSSVIAAHFDTREGTPGPFYQVDTLLPGDAVYVYDTTGNHQTFEVVGQTIYPNSEFPVNLVFSRRDKPRLNLITCSGDFNSVQNSYEDRVVVYTELADRI